MKKVVIVLVTMFLLVSSAYADEVKTTSQPKWSVEVDHWAEWGPKVGAKAPFQYQYERIAVRSDLGRVQVNIFTDRSRAGYRCILLGTPSYPLVHGSWGSLKLSPGIVVTNRNQLFLGGDIQLDLPKLGVSVLQRSYRTGTGADLHLTYARWFPTKSVGLIYHMNASRTRAPEAYLGPTVKIGSIFVEGGPSITRSHAWLLNTGFRFKF